MCPSSGVPWINSDRFAIVGQSAIIVSFRAPGGGTAEVGMSQKWLDGNHPVEIIDRALHAQLHKAGRADQRQLNFPAGDN